MKPRRKCTHPEREIHCAIVDYLRCVMPDALVVYTKNEINKSGGIVARELAQAVRMGMMRGWPDLSVFMDGGGIVFFEVKAAEGRVSDAQHDVHQKLIARGFPVRIVRSIDDVRAALSDLSIVTREVAA